MAFDVGGPKAPKKIKPPTDEQKQKIELAKGPVAKPKKSPEDSRLSFGYWWVENKEMVKNGFILAALAIGGLLLLYGIYGYVDYYLISYSKNQKLFEPRQVSLNWNYIQQISMPLEIQADSVRAIRSKENYDIVTRVTNPNDKWHVSKLDYHFTFGSATTDSKTSFILPGETTYLVELNQERSGGATANLVVEDLEWTKEPDFAALKEQLLRFELSDIAYTPASQTGISGTQPINQVSFKIKNNSAQNFWNIDLIIQLYAGTQLRAINTYNLNSLDSLEEREVVLNWPGVLPAINKVEVIPQIDILDPDSYKGFGEVIGEEK